MKVVVAHPGLQYAHQLAWALDEAGWLAAFWSGVPVRDGSGRDTEFWGRLNSVLRSVPIPASRRRHYPAFPLARRAVSKLLPETKANHWNHRLDHAYDAFISPRLAARRPDVVVAYENSALRTFQAAKRLGAKCVLDAASVHYRMGREWSNGAIKQNPAWVDDQKEEEIRLADLILTCSDLAADTYRSAGVQNSKVVAVPLGTDLPTLVKRDNSASGFCSFVFAGSISRRKGVDLLLDVFQRFNGEGVTAKLTLIGGAVEQDLVQRSLRMDNVTYIPFLPQRRLFEAIAGHDCLVLPSRFDSFGMVVPEAMACGLPVIVSERVGAKCIVQQHPGSGWIVPCQPESLYECMRTRTRDAAYMRNAAAAARRAAADYSWPAYRERIRGVFRERLANLLSG
jgi:glycosyltransferase involved in cell wall biosynthesis